MRILFADPDRDLLQCYRSLLTDDGHEVVTVFDGTQALTQLKRSAFDFVFLNREIPRVGSERIVAELNERGVPVVLLCDRLPQVEDLLSPVLCNALLCFPFTPHELRQCLTQVAAVRRGKEILRCDDVTIEVPRFAFAEGTRVTLEEMLVLWAILHEQMPNIPRAAFYVETLNRKFAMLQKKQRIQYIRHQGYRVVKQDV